jgi:hypothetical protein
MNQQVFASFTDHISCDFATSRLNTPTAEAAHSRAIAAPAKCQGH